MPSTRHVSHVTLLPGLRSSHLEQREPDGSLTLYWRTRKDLDSSLIREGIQVRPLSTREIWNLILDPPEVVEIVEPLYVRYWLQSFALAVALKSAAGVRRRRQLTVAY